MGTAYADCLDAPRSTQICVGDFMCLVGEPSVELVCNRDVLSGPFAIAVPQHAGWEQAIEQKFGERATWRMRYAMKKEEDCFDFARLQGYVEGISQEYMLRLIDAVMYEATRASVWSRDLCSNFPTWEDYARHGLGVVACKGNEIVWGHRPIFGTKVASKLRLIRERTCGARGLRWYAAPS